MNPDNAEEYEVTYEDKLTLISERRRLLESMRKHGFSTPKKFTRMLEVLNSIEQDIITCNTIKKIEEVDDVSR